MAGRSNKEYRTAEVFGRSKTIFLTSIFRGSLFCCSAVYLFRDVIAGFSKGSLRSPLKGFSLLSYKMSLILNG